MKASAYIHVKHHRGGVSILEVCDASGGSRLSRPSLQEVQNLLDKEAVRCIFIQDNPTFDSLRSSLGLPRSHLTSASQPSDCQLAIQVQPLNTTST